MSQTTTTKKKEVFRNFGTHFEQRAKLFIVMKATKGNEKLIRFPTQSQDESQEKTMFNEVQR
jgi:hypothetical protein